VIRINGSGRRKCLFSPFSSLGLVLKAKTGQTQHGCMQNRSLRLCLKDNSVKVPGPGRLKLTFSAQRIIRTRNRFYCQEEETINPARNPYCDVGNSIYSRPSEHFPKVLIRRRTNWHRTSVPVILVQNKKAERRSSNEKVNYNL
jgi:hypothetical protein